MRLALITDIHGNAIALRAVLDAIATQAVDQIYCLGDIAADGAHPNDCIRILQENAIPSVQGNTDAFLLNPHKEHFPDERRRRFHEIALWSSAQLGTPERDFLTNLPPVIEIPEQALLLYHGSPRHFEDLILPDTPESQLEQYFEGYQGRFFAGGHIHAPMLRSWGRRKIVTVGSVGLAAYRLPDGDSKPLPYAEYAILDFEGDNCQILFCQVPFDVSAFHQSLHDADVPHAKWLISRWQ